MKASVFITATALAVTALAHGGIDKYITGDKVYEGWEPYNDPAGQKSIQRQYSSYDPLFIKDLTTVNIRCNNKGALGTGVTGTIAAGAKLTTHWKQWTHRPATFMVYMAKCPGSCDSWDGSGKVWFKIFEQGLISGTENAGIWAGDAIFETLNATITVPNVLAGEYMFRHELTALHQANNPQFYPECAQFTVTGSGTASPPASYLVSFPGAYTGTEPGLAFNIDSEDAKKATKYPLPGPQLWDGNDSGNATTPGSATPSTAATKQRGADTSGRLRRHGKC